MKFEIKRQSTQRITCCSYLSWLNKPLSLYEEEQPYLTVCNLVLPHDASVSVDRGAQSEKWTKKRPRLQSAKLNQIHSRQKSSPAENPDEETKLSEEEKDSEIMEIQQVMEEYEIDENVQRLIQEAAEYDLKSKEKKEDEEKLSLDEDKQSIDVDEVYKRRHKKHKTKEKNNVTKEKAKPKLSRTVTLSLSRPPSPETVQVIRVDVTSNYSMEELEGGEGSETEESSGSESSLKREKNQMARSSSNRLHAQKGLIKRTGLSVGGELTLHCQRLALSDRRSSGLQ